jgi:nucleoside-specific outer membrane channel protein Tsx
MKIKTLPNGNMNLEGIKFETGNGSFTVGRHHIDVSGQSCYYIIGLDIDVGVPSKVIVSLFATKQWRVKLLGKPTKIMKRLTF